MARPRRGTAIISVKTVGAGDVARNFDRAARALQDRLIRELRRLAPDVVETVRFFAPVDSSDLANRLAVRLSFLARQPKFTVVSPTTHGGYPYTAVTRFGHRKAIIQGRPLLTIHGPGRTEITRLATSVRGVGHGGPYKPHDWVATAAPLVNDHVERAGARLGRSITSELLAGSRIR